MSADIWLPADFNKANNQKFRLMIFLHGADPDNSQKTINTFKEAFEIYTGAVNPPVIIVPDVRSTASQTFGNRHLYANSVYHGNYEDVITKDLINFLKTDTVFNFASKISYQREHMAIGGFSMGADGALRIALRNPDMFKVALIHAAIPSFSDQVITTFATLAKVESCETLPCQFSVDAINKPITYRLWGASSAWSPSDQNGEISFLLNNDGSTNTEVLNYWKSNYEPATLISNQGIYSSTDGPYLYLEVGDQDGNKFATFPNFIDQLKSIGVPEQFYKTRLSSGSHIFDALRAVGSLTYLLNNLDDIVTSSKNYAQEIGLKIFPNPVNSNQLYLSVKDLFQSGAVGLKIFDPINGRVIYSHKYEHFSDIKEINISNLTDGLYFLSVQFNGKVNTLPFVIN
ncbi:MAG: T9SS type A sorting domain-containing protein [Saprospiraceae bacterium]|nr:T9SS type A sorting domain-containing protein [Saprospiraceae bacterium]